MSTMAAMIRASSDAGTLTVLTHRGYAELADDLGSDEAAMRWLIRQATRAGVPIAVNFPTTADLNGPSTTMMIPPAGWSEERLAGWIAGRHAELSEVFGEIEGVRRMGTG